MPAPLPRRGYGPVRASLCFPVRHRPSPNYRRVGSRIALFEACSAFTHVPACAVAELLIAALCHRSASVHVVTSTSRSGCYQPKTTIVGRDSHPPGKRAFPRRTAICGLRTLQDLCSYLDRDAQLWNKRYAWEGASKSEWRHYLDKFDALFEFLQETEAAAITLAKQKGIVK